MSVRPACMGNRARLSERSDKYRGRILDNKRQVSGVSAATGGRNDQFSRKRNFVASYLLLTTVGAAFQPRSCNYGYRATFFAAKSRSHEKLMLI
jgi:hypothetical protein